MGKEKYDLQSTILIKFNKLNNDYAYYQRHTITFTINQFISLSITHITQFTNYTHHSPKATAVYILWPRTRKLNVCNVTSLSDKAARKN
jgi:hypothetical protein